MTSDIILIIGGSISGLMVLVFIALKLLIAWVDFCEDSVSCGKIDKTASLKWSNGKNVDLYGVKHISIGKSFVIIGKFKVGKPD